MNAINFDAINAAALARLPDLLPEWFPAGRQDGSEYKVGNVRGDPGQSLSVNTQSGVWKDFANGESGSDPVSLYAARQGIGMGEAARKLAGELGIAPAGGDPKSQRGKPRRTASGWRAIVPVPHDAPAPTFIHDRLGKAADQWQYVNATGNTIFWVCRWNLPDGEKQILPMTYGVNGTGSPRWDWKGAPGPLPLYGLPQLYAKPDAKVIVCEGEKSADAAQRAFPGAAVTTSAHGSKASRKSDWSVLKGRTVGVWADHDAAGLAYANDVLTLCHAAGAKSLTLMRVKDGVDKPESWDAADAESEGLTAAILKDVLDVQAWTPPVEPESTAHVDSNRPIINVEGGQLPAMIDKGESALLAMPRHGLYQRNGAVVRVARLDKPETGEGTGADAIKREAGAPQILAVEWAGLLEMFTRAANWQQWDARKDGYKPIDCPKPVAVTYLTRAGEWHLPHLTGIITAPTLRADGTLLNVPGYDEQSGLLFMGESIPGIPDKPTQKNARAAIETLTAPLGGFPWVVADAGNDESEIEESPKWNCNRSVILSAILTGLVRHILSTAPLHGISATAPGTGKSLLADFISLIVSGQEAPAMTWPREQAEAEKRLFSALLAGDSLLLIDNAEHPLGGEILNSALTQSTLKGRVLGESRNANVPTRVLLLATGNNLQVHGDTTRRLIVSRLDAGMEHPETRQFQLDLKDYARRHRQELIAAGLVVLRAYIVAGKPDQGCVPFGGFEDWSALVRSALVWAGEADPCRTRLAIEATDENARQREAVLGAWFAQFGPTPKALGAVVKDADDDLKNALLDIAGEKGAAINTRRLGRWFSKQEGRITKGLRLHRGTVASKVQTWCVRQVEQRKQVAA